MKLYECFAYRLARNLFRALQRSRKLMRNISGQADDNPRNNYITGDPAKNHTLGKCYQRKTRFRQPIMAAKLHKMDGGRLCGVYSTLKCSDICEPEFCNEYISTTFPPIKPGVLLLTGALAGNKGTDHNSHSEDTVAEAGLGSNVELPKFEHTEFSLLPMIHQCKH